jgi:hypothetical protein
MSSRTLYRLAVAQTYVSENVSSPSSRLLRVIGFHGCITVEKLLHCLSIRGYDLWSKNTVLICFHDGVNYRCFLGLCTV